MIKESVNTAKTVFDASAFVWDLVDSADIFPRLARLTEEQLASVRCEVEKKLAKRQLMLRRVRGSVCASIRTILNYASVTDRFTMPPADSNEFQRMGRLNYIADCVEQLQNRR